MDYSYIDNIREEKRYTKKMVCEKLGMTTNGYDRAIKNSTLKVRDLEKLAEILDVPVGIFFQESTKQNFFNEGDNSPISIGGSISQKGKFGNKKGVDTNNDKLMLQERNKFLEEKIEGLLARLDLKDEIIELLKAK